jgi:hypothetical protein
MIRPRWRQVTGAVAIYALILHGFLLGIVGARLGAVALNEAAFGLERCLHDHDSGPVSPREGPGGHDVSCMLCVAGCHDAAAATAVVPLRFVVLAGATAPRVGDGRHTHNLTNYPGPRPRGPPLVA